MLSWLDTLPPAFTTEHKAALIALFDWLMPPLLRVATKEVPSVLPMQEINVAVSCMQLFESLLVEWRDASKARTRQLLINPTCSIEA
jgi:dynein heavy chain, axonemal